MPYDWNGITVAKYPILSDKVGKLETTRLHYQLKRTNGGMILKISADQALNPIVLRLGPFEKQHEISKIRVNGQIPPGASIERSGDSWWIRFIQNVD